MSEETLYYKGAYRGVPFEIHFDDRTPWAAVDPKKIDPANGVFMCCLSTGNGEWTQAAYGEAQGKLVNAALTAVRANKQPQMIKNIKERLGAKDWDKLVIKHSSETAALEHTLEEIGMQSPESWARILDLAEVGHIYTDISVSPTEQYQTLYFFEDGRQITYGEACAYDKILARASNWVKRRVFSAHLPMGESYGFCDVASPTPNKLCEINEHIQDQIEASLSPYKGDHIVETVYVTSQAKDGKYHWQPDSKQTVSFHLDREAEAKQLAEFYVKHRISHMVKGRNPAREPSERN